MIQQEGHQSCQQSKHIKFLLQDIVREGFILPFKNAVAQHFQSGLPQFLVETNNEGHESSVDLIFYKEFSAALDRGQVDEDTANDPSQGQLSLQKGVKHLHDVAPLIAIANNLGNYLLLLRNVQQQKQSQLEFKSLPFLQLEANWLYQGQILKQELAFSSKVDQCGKADGCKFWREYVFPQEGDEGSRYEHMAGLGSGGVLQDGANGAVLHFRTGIGEQLQQIIRQFDCQSGSFLLHLLLLPLLLHQQLYINHHTHNANPSIFHL